MRNEVSNHKNSTGRTSAACQSLFRWASALSWYKILADKLRVGSAQAQHIDFAFHTLGWYQFQNLTATILSEVLGQTVEVAAPGNDAGIDAFFQGTWESRDGTSLAGSFVAQSKFCRYQGRTLPASALKQDANKVAELVQSGLCDNYLIFTNYTLSFVRKIAMEKSVRSWTGAKIVKIYGPDQLAHWIKGSSRLRMMLPRVYGLGDLSQIIDDRARRQAVAILESFKSRLVTVVPTDAYRKAAIALDEHNFVLLIGDPMTGKTTVSYALALAGLDHLGLNVFVIKHPDELREYWDPLDPHRFYWIDDAFGQTQFDYSLATAWNRQIDRVRAAVEKGARFVLTTRSYIWNEAAHTIKRYALPLLDNSQVHIYVQDLTRREKRQMLYHHLRMGDQPTAFKEAVHPHLEALSELKNFLPEAARRLGNPFFTTGLLAKPSKESLQRFFSEPLQILVDIISELDRHSRGLLTVLFSKSGHLDAPIVFDTGDRAILELIGTTPIDAVNAASALNESLIRRQIDPDGAASYVFAHPTIRDAVAAIMAANPDMVGIYLAGVDLKNALSEITCGDIGFKGVKVTVPPASFDLFFHRLKEYASGITSWREEYEPTEFLLHRCSRAFLAHVVERDTDFLMGLNSLRWKPSTSDPWLRLTVKLNELNLLPEEMRLRAVAKLSASADEDIGFVRKAKFMALFKTNEWDELRNTIAQKYVPGLRETAMDHKFNYDRDYGSPENYFDTLVDYCEIGAELFDDNPALVDLLRHEREYLDETISDLASEYGDDEDDDNGKRESYNVASLTETEQGGRDVFEDVADPN